MDVANEQRSFWANRSDLLNTAPALATSPVRADTVASAVGRRSSSRPQEQGTDRKNIKGVTCRYWLTYFYISVSPNKGLPMKQTFLDSIRKSAMLV